MSVILECPVCEARFKINKVPARLQCPACKTSFKTNYIKPAGKVKPAASKSQRRPATDAGAAAADIPGQKPATPPPVQVPPTEPRAGHAGTPVTPPPAPTATPSAPPAKPANLAQAPRRLQSTPSVSPPEFNADSSLPPAFQAKPNTESLSVPLAPSAPSTATTGSDIAIESNLQGKTHYAMRPRKNIWVTITSLLLAVAAIGGLFTIVTILGQPADKPQQTKTDTEDVVTETDALDDALSKSKAEPKEKKAPELPPVDETLEFFNARQCEIAWSKVNGYLVKLDVKTPLRNRTMTGLIVDSRGWVVTSLKGLEDAGQVTVTLAGKNLSDQPPFRELVDLSRGIIATDPKHDLALISINRAQVINLADIKLAEQDNLVESKRMLIARTPPPRHRQWLAECRIAGRKPLSQLSDSIKNEIESAGLHEDTEIRWIVAPPRLPTDLAQELAGSPIIDENGIVHAINTGLQPDKQSIAVPVKVVRELLASVPAGSPELQAFTRSADLIRQTAGETGAGAESDVEVDPIVSAEVRAAQKFDSIMTNLMQAVDECRKTDWTAELDSEYNSMQNMSRHMDEVMEWFSRNPGADQERWNEAIDEITLSIEDDLERTEFAEGKGNKFFAEETNTENPWFMISAEVVANQINSPTVKGQETITFKVLGTSKHVLAAAGAGANSFRQGRRFILFGQLDPSGSVNSKHGRVQLINVHTHFWLRSR